LPGNLVSSRDKNVEGRLDDATVFRAISWMSVQRIRLRVLVQLSIELDLPPASLGGEDLGKSGRTAKNGKGQSENRDQSGNKDRKAKKAGSGSAGSREAGHAHVHPQAQFGALKSSQTIESGGANGKVASTKLSPNAVPGAKAPEVRVSAGGPGGGHHGR
jgi:hypothetical protein